MKRQLTPFFGKFVKFWCREVSSFLLFVAVLLLNITSASGASQEPSWVDGTGGFISTADELVWLSLHPEAWDDDWVLTADIEFDTDVSAVDWNGNGLLGDLSETALDETGNPYYTYLGDDIGLSPIGSRTEAFTGSFDGGGHTISNLYINSLVVDIALFGSVGFDDDGADISNLGLLSPHIVSYGDITDSWRNVGSLVGLATSSDISNCYVTDARVFATYAYVGGLIGRARGSMDDYYSTPNTLTDCYVTGSTLSLPEAYLGSGILVGYCGYQDVESCYVTDSYIYAKSKGGGMIGQGDHANLTYCYVTNSVIDIVGFETNGIVGGLVAALDIGIINECYTSVTLPSTTTTLYSGGIVGVLDRGTGTGNTAHSEVKNSYASGTILNGAIRGGVAGMLDRYAVVKNSFASGYISDVNEERGGIYGEIDTWYTPIGTSTNSFYDSETTQATKNGTPKTTEEFENLTELTGLSTFWGATNRPRLKWRANTVTNGMLSRDLNANGEIDISERNVMLGQAKKINASSGVAAASAAVRYSKDAVTWTSIGATLSRYDNLTDSIIGDLTGVKPGKYYIQTTATGTDGVVYYGDIVYDDVACKIIYVDGGSNVSGMPDPDTDFGDAGDDFTTSSTVPLRTNYVFDKWKATWVNDAGTTVEITVSDAGVLTLPEGDVTLTALWISNNPESTITITELTTPYTSSAIVFPSSNYTEDSDGAVTVSYRVSGEEWTTIAPTSAGTYDIKVATAESANFAPTEEVLEGGLVITQLPLTVTTSAIQKEYDGTATATVASSTLEGLISGDAVTLTVPTAFAYDDASAAIDKVVTSNMDYAVAGDDVENYTFTAPTLTGIITQKALTIKADGKERLFNVDNPTFTFTCDGFIAGEDNNVLSTQPVLGTVATKTSAAGTYSITFTTDAEAANYAITQEDGTLTIIATYAVLYDGNGSDGGSVPTDNSVYAAGDEVTVKTGSQTKTGYDFDSWKATWMNTGNETDILIDNGIFTMPEGETTLTAQWTAATDTRYTVKHFQQKVDATGYTLRNSDVRYGTTGEIAVAVVKTEYIGFYEDATNASRVPSGTIVADGTLVLQLYYNRLDYTVSYDAMNGTAVSTQTGVLYGASVGALPTVPTKTGYVFSGWYTEINGGGDAFESTTEVTEDITVYAYWTAGTSSYTVEHYKQSIDGTVYDLVAEDVETNTGTTDEVVSAVAKTTTEYVGFTENTNHADYYPTGTVTANGLLVLKLYYDRNLYTVSYDTHGGSTIAPTTDISYGATVETLPIAPTRLGYEFEGWYTGEDGAGTEFLSTTVVEDDITVHAYWIAIDYTLSYSADDITNGMVPMAVTGIHIDDIVVVSGDAGFIREGYTFAGWQSDESTPIMYEENDEFTMGANDVVLTAQWSPNANTAYTVQYFLQKVTPGEGYAKEVDATDVLYGETGSFVTATVKDFEGFYEFESSNFRVPDGVISGDGSLVLKLYYNRNKFTVSYDENGGSAVNDTTGVRYGATVNLPNNPTKIGYTFGGWNTEAAGTGASFTSETPITEDITVYAQWGYGSANYTVKHFQQVVTGDTYVEMRDDEEIITSATGTTVTAVAMASYTGFTVNNSAPDAVPSGVVEADGSLVLKLYYDRDTYTVTYDANGGSPDSDETGVRYGATVNLPANPTREGYSFNGWTYYDVDLDIDLDFTALTIITSDITALAQWDVAPADYTVKHYKQQVSGNGYDEMHSDEQTIETANTGTTVMAVPLTTSDYNGFTVNTGVAGSVPSGVVKPDGSLILKLYYDRDTYTVTYVENDGSDVDDATGVRHGATVVLPAEPTKTGYVFDGWTTVDGGTIYFTEASLVTADITVYAKWNVGAANYTVQHFQQAVVGSDCAVIDEDVIASTTGTNVDAVANTYTGFDLNTTAAGAVPSGTVEADGSLLLKLYYDRLTYTVTYNSHGGTDVDDATNVRYEATVILPTNPTKTGYTFGGWTLVEGGGDYFTTDTKVTGDITVHAKWIANTDTEYTVEHYKQTLPGTDYYLVTEDTEIKHGTTDTEVTAVAKTTVEYPGFSENITYSERVATGTITAVGDLVLKLYYDRDEHTVVYDAQNSTTNIIESGILHGNTVGALPSEPSRVGYTFIEWNTAADGSGTEFTSATTVAGDITVYAQWIAIDYTVTYVASSATSGSVPSELTGNHIGDVVIVSGVSDLVRTGYTFAGWLSDEASPVTYQSGDELIIGASNVVLTVQWAAIDYSVSYTAVDATSGTVPAAGLGLNIGDEMTVSGANDLARTGYTFAGWLSDEALPQNYNAGEKLTIGASDVVMTAQWTAIDYQVTYVAPDTISGTVPEVVTGINIGDAVTVSGADNFVLQGYTFAGWESDESPSAVYQSGDVLTMGAGDVILTALWTPNTDTEYIVQHFLQKVTPGEGYARKTDATQTLTGVTGEFVTAEAQEFEGFFEFESSGFRVPSGTIAADGSLVLKLYYNRHTFDVTYDAQGGSAVAQEKNVRYGGTVILPTAPTKTGYTFSGWKTDVDSIFDETYEIYDDITVYAQWTAIDYTLTYVASDATSGTVPVATTDNNINDVVIVTGPGDLVRTAYTFAGWKSNEATPVIYSEGDQLILGSSDIVLTAQWTAIDYTVTYEATDATSGAVPAEVTGLHIGDKVTVSGDGNLARIGYTFAGWKSNEPTSVIYDEGDELTIGSMHIVLTAQWTANTNTPYVVNHYKQNVSDDFYTLSATIGLTGVSDDSVTVVEEDYTGFTADTNNVLTKVILADGTQVFDLYYNRETYTVTYEENNGSSVENATGVRYGATVTLPPTTRVGYTFDRWTAAEDGSGDAFTSTTLVVADITVYAQWTANTTTVYTVNHHQQNISDDAYTLFASESFTGTSDASVTVSEESYTGFTADPNNVLTKVILADGTQVFDLYYDRETYTVTYDEQTGSDVADATGVRYGATVVLPTTIKTGYTFGSWNTVANGTGNTFTSTTAVVADITVYAQWTANTTTVYTVNHHQQNISDDAYTLFATESLSGTSDASVTVSEESYTGFTADPNNVLTKVILADGSQVFDLYYDRETYTVTYDEQTGSDVADATGVRYGATVVLPTTTKTGYTFVNWNTDADGTGDIFTATTAVVADITVYAQWVANTNTVYTVNHHQQNISDDAYTLFATESFTGTSDASVTVSEESYTGFTADPNNVLTKVILADGTQVFDLYYDRETYTVTYDEQTGSDVADATGVRYGATVVLPITTKIGYTFGSWNTVADGTGDVFTATTAVVADITVYAQWTANTNTVYTVNHHQQNISDDAYTLFTTVQGGGETGTSVTVTEEIYTGFTADPNNVLTKVILADGSQVFDLYYDRETYTVTYDEHTGSDVADATGVRYGATVVLPTTTKIGYTFVNWNTVADGTGDVFTATTAVVADITVYAQWVANTNTVYTVNHHQQNISDDAYTLFATESLTGTSDASVTVSEESYTGFTADPNNVLTKVILADGSQVFDLYYDRDTYTVTYDEQTGSDVADATGVRYGATVVLPTTAKTGYTFGSWNTDADGTGDVFTATTAVVADITVYAQWVANTSTVYTVNHHQQNISDDAYTLFATESLTGTSDVLVTVNEENYTGFTADPNNVLTKVILADGTQVFDLYYDRETYTVTYDEQTGSDVADATDVRYGATVVLPITTKIGYTFGSWNTDAAGTGNTFTSTTAVVADITVYAQWTANTTTVYTVNHHQQNISDDAYTLFATENLTGTSDASVTVSEENYTGFTADPNNVLTKVILADGSQVFDLYYDRDTYTVTYDEQTGSDVADATGVRYGATVVLPITTKIGYTFGSWNTDAAGTGNTFTATTAVVADITVYAQWTANTTTVYTVNHHQQNISDDAYTLFASESFTGTSDASVTVSEESYTGFTADPNNVLTKVILADGSQVFDLYYDRETYTVTYDEQAGSDVNDATGVRYGATVVLPTTTKIGYTFGSWNTDAAGTGNTFTATTAVVADITVYAQWTANTTTVYTVNHHQQNISDDAYTLFATVQGGGETGTSVTVTEENYTGFTADPNNVLTKVILADGSQVFDLYYDRDTYTVTYDEQTGSDVADATDVRYGATVVLPITTKIGYTFGSWNTDAAGTGNTFTATTAVVADITVYAQWISIAPLQGNEWVVTDEDTPVTTPNVLDNNCSNGAIVNIEVLTSLHTALVTYNTTDSTFTYVPADNFHGNDSILYRVCNNDGECVDDTVFITVNSVNDLPVPGDIPGVVPEDGVLIDTIPAYDADGDSLVFEIVVPTPNGETIIDDSIITYIPNPDFNGVDTLIYEVCDTVECVTDTIIFDVTPVNDLPVIGDIPGIVPEDGVLIDTIPAHDADGDSLVFEIVVPTPNGETIIDDSVITYIPDPDFNGVDTLIYEVCDTVECITDTIIFDVRPVNDAPVAVADIDTTAVNVPVTTPVLQNDSDVDGDILSIDITGVLQVSNGSIILTDDSIMYTPDLDFSGRDSFQYIVEDGNGGADTAIVIVDVITRPIAIDDHHYVEKGESISLFILENDTAISGNLNPLSIDLDPAYAGRQHVRSVAEGTFTVEHTGELTFIPNDEDYVGDITVIHYTVCDDNNIESNQASVSINIFTSYTVTYYANGGVGAPIDTDLYYENDTVILSDSIPSRAAHAFVGWTYAGQTYHPADTLLMPAADLEFIAQWIIRPVAVDDNASFKSGASIVLPILQNDTAQLGDLNPSTIDLYPTALYPDSIGYQQTHAVDQGVFTVNNLGEVIFTAYDADFLGDVTAIYYDVCDHSNVSSNLASIQINIYGYHSITYDANGGIGAPIDTNRYYALDTVYVPDSIPSKEAHTFTGWLYNGTIYKAGHVGTMPNASIVAVAQWTIKPVAIDDQQSFRTSEPFEIYILDNDTAHYGYLDPATIDLYPNALYPDSIGYQQTRSVDEGLFTVGHSGEVTFTPYDEDYIGDVTTIYYDVCDNNGIASNQAFIQIDIYGPHTLTYNGNGGIGVPQTAHYFEYDYVIISDTIPVRGAYIFTQWLYNGISYMAGDILDMPAHSVELVAQWDSIRIPEIFTPNDDNIHDYFVLPWLDHYEGQPVQVQMFNRWGDLVYLHDDYDNSWNGECNQGISRGGTLPAGTYFYTILIPGESQRRQGFVYITR